MPYWGAYFGQPIRVSVPPEFASETALLDYLGLSTAELRKIWFFRNRMYQHFLIAKGPNKFRMISAPDKRLKFLQRKLAEKLAELYRPRHPVHGFVPGRSVKTNALAHFRRRFVINIDLKDFFPSITENRVKGMLRSLNIDSRVAEIIARICCNNGHLPQGAPSSPVLSNMICFRLDRQLLTVAKEARCIYTRYADDITFSSHQPPKALFEATLPPAGRISLDDLATNLCDAIHNNGFEINQDKAHYADRHSRRMVTGLKVNQLLNVDRRYVRNIRAALHSIEKLGSDGAEKKFHEVHGGRSSLAGHLRGKISYLTHIKGQSDPVVRGVTLRFNKCFPAHPINLRPTPAEVQERAVWVVEHPEFQGTAFFLKGVGLVTAAHCVKDVDEVEILHPSKHANMFKVKVQKIDQHRDLAVLSHEVPETEFFELDAASQAVATGDQMTAIGYPGWAPGDPLNVRPGVVSAETIKNGVKLIEVAQKLPQGMSGGPLLDINDTVCGIIHKGGPDEGRDFAIHIEVLKKWLKEM